MTDHGVDPTRLTDEVVWDGPRFEVPTLGLVGATIGEILIAVKAKYGEDRATAAALHFHAAMDSDGEEAAEYFRYAVEAGDMKAHFALGYTLVELGRPHEAYSHLRRYTEMVPLNSWSWCWLGQACEAMGDIAEARLAYGEAVRLEIEVGSFETDAAERLDRLDEAA